MKKIESCNIQAKVVGCKRLITVCKRHNLPQAQHRATSACAQTVMPHPKRRHDRH